MTVGTVTVKLPKDLYTRLDTLAKQERTDVVALLNRLAASRRRRGRRLSHLPPRSSAFLAGLPIWA